MFVCIATEAQSYSNSLTFFNDHQQLMKDDARMTLSSRHEPMNNESHRHGCYGTDRCDRTLHWEDDFTQLHMSNICSDEIFQHLRLRGEGSDPTFHAQEIFLLEVQPIWVGSKGIN